MPLTSAPIAQGDGIPRRLAPRIGMVSSCYYKNDPRVRRHAEALADHGYAVDVLCMSRPGEPAVEQLHGVTVWRVGSAKYRGHSLTRYARSFGGFFLQALTTLTW